MKQPLIDYAAHWQGMPEFVQDDQTPYHAIKVQFADLESAEAFSSLIGQNIVGRRRPIWYPAQPQENFEQYRYISFDDDDAA